ncbi:phosphoadenosine phosphosulfate reductase family protein [Bacillus cereus]|uniref:phosphoadenosine phosphosulfate reductase domain-containing protein n=1 Tax=Bacillus cereus TaxID=1396 RepID=UPI00187A267E|nr:phosphoadenosine phosphosulfate reductase family protein [Bacillus cereus]MBE7123134.1 phosphoadenosine phosphosulfate reductase [Bacillus cereus]
MFKEIMEIKEEMKQVYLINKGKCLLAAVSGGKDSSCMLTLLFEAISELPIELRTTPIHVLIAHTRVETPAMTKYQYRLVEQIRLAAEKGDEKGPLPFVVHEAVPTMKESFWFKTIGKGTPAPTGNVRTRWCTFTLKINPMERIMKKIIKDYHQNQPVTLSVEEERHDAILMIGSRVEESARRRATIAKYQSNSSDKFNIHASLSNVLCYLPIKYLTGDEVFFYLLEKGNLPYGIHVEELTVQYGSSMLECGIKTEGQGSSCGSSRSGCWTCLISGEKDKMLAQLIGEGNEMYQNLQSWKSLFYKMRNDVRYREVMNRRKMTSILKNKSNVHSLFGESDELAYDYLMFERVEENGYCPGALSVPARKLLLEYLLYIQEEMNEELITEEDISAILFAWKEDGFFIERNELSPTYPYWEGELILTPEGQVNEKLTTTANQLFYVTVEMRLPKSELFRYLKKRQQETMQNFFFFPSNVSDPETKLTWNKVTFVVCQSDITKEKDAERVIYSWLGSYPISYFNNVSMSGMITKVIKNTLLNEPLFDSNVNPGIQLLLATEITSRISYLLKHEDLDQNTSRLFSTVIKQLAEDFTHNKQAV